MKVTRECTIGDDTVTLEDEGEFDEVWVKMESCISKQRQALEAEKALLSEETAGSAHERNQMSQMFNQWKNAAVPVQINDIMKQKTAQPKHEFHQQLIQDPFGQQALQAQEQFAKAIGASGRFLGKAKELLGVK